MTPLPLPAHKHESAGVAEEVLCDNDLPDCRETDKWRRRLGCDMRRMSKQRGIAQRARVV